MSHEAPLPDAKRFSRAVGAAQVRKIQPLLQQLLQFPEGRFPGSQVVSFEARHLEVLQQQRYVACEKSDGTRYLLYILRGSPFLIDRKFSVLSAPLHFPRRQIFHREKTVVWHDGTVLDGELVVDRKPGAAGHEFCFLIYDACAINGVSILSAPLLERLQAVRDHVLVPREKLRASSAERATALAKEPCRIVLKTMYPLDSLPHLFRTVLPSLPHENDGLIFTPMDAPYTLGTDYRLLKWKPLHLNSVDFAAHVEFRGVPPRPRVQLMVNRNGAPEAFSWLDVASDQVHVIAGGISRQLDGKIVECTYDPEKETEWPPADPTSWVGGERTPGAWQYMRLRDDKRAPNELRTVRAVVQSQRDNVTEEVLCQAVCPAAGAAAARAPAPVATGGGGEGNGQGVGSAESGAAQAGVLASESGEDAPPAKRARHGAG